MDVFWIVLSAFSVWLVITIISLYFFIQYRHEPTIQHRSVSLTCLFALFNSVLIGYLLYKLARPITSCIARLWIPSLVFPLLVLTILGKLIRLIFLGRYHKSIYLEAKLESITEEIECGYGIELSEESFMGAQRNMNIKETWYCKYRHLFTTSRIIETLSAFLLLHLGITAVVNTISPMSPALIPGGECLMGWEYYPFIGSLIIYLFLGVPVLLYWFWGIDDVYGIRKELISVGIISMVGFFLYLVFWFLPSLRVVEKTFAAYVWGAITLVLIHILFVIYPIYELRKSRQARANAKNTQVFDQILSDPILFEDFKAFTIKDFSVENPLFYERCKKLRTSHTSNTRLPGKNLTNKTRNELNSMFQTFINPKSEFQVNLSSATIQELTRQFESGELSLNMFARAEWEIHLLMYQNTFPRYLRYTSLI
ncbi:hypothetical protein K7432_002115 [Basidiobolus ranarum]|uniref:RGS domain-containing protein n=1 Tax=Basidiobolus ranarum TaxID=34480 RepID=A0ABR2X1X1_9FUNG